MKEHKAPQNPNETSPLTSVFLAGSIEMGAAELWQDRVSKELKEFNISIFNPRRDDWDSSWEQKIENPQFFEQVSWELKFLESASIAFFYFDPKTKSPITLMELGYVLGSKSLQEIIVVCPEGFWRKGNVDIICQRNGIGVLSTLESGITHLKDSLIEFHVDQPFGRRHW